jgi:hypothetical protein
VVLEVDYLDTGFPGSLEDAIYRFHSRLDIGQSETAVDIFSLGVYNK